MPIVTETLKLETIKDIDPRIEGVFQYHVERARADCLNRPTDKTERKIIVEFTFEPIMDPESRECDAINMTVNAVNAELANIESILASQVKCPVFRGRP